MAEEKYIQSLVRGLTIVDLIADSDDGLSLRRVCELTGLKRATGHNLVKTLVSTGYVERAIKPIRYRLGRRVLDVAAKHYDTKLVRCATKVMTQLFGDLRDVLMLEYEPNWPDDATIVLSRPIGGDAVMFLRVTPERPDVVERPTKSHHPYGSAVSLVMQAFWTEDERQAYRAKYPFWQHGAALWETEQKLDEFLAGVRELGYAAPKIHGPEVNRVAVPVFGHGKQLVAVLGAGKWRKLSKPRWRKCIDHALAASAELGRQLSEQDVD